MAELCLEHENVDNLLGIYRDAVLYRYRKENGEDIKKLNEEFDYVPKEPEVVAGEILEIFRELIKKPRISLSEAAKLARQDLLNAEERRQRSIEKEAEYQEEL